MQRYEKETIRLIRTIFHSLIRLIRTIFHSLIRLILPTSSAVRAPRSKKVRARTS